MYICMSLSRYYLYIDMVYMLLFFFKQKTAYEMRISDWSSDVCSSDLSCWARFRDKACVARRCRTWAEIFPLTGLRDWRRTVEKRIKLLKYLMFLWR